MLNRYVSSSPITRERIETALGQPIYVTLPRDDKSYGEQQITGADLWQIRSASALRESLEALAHKLYRAQTGEEAEPQTGLFGKLLRALNPGRSSHNGTD